jgi:hypothetical protein
MTGIYNVLILIKLCLDCEFAFFFICQMPDFEGEGLITNVYTLSAHVNMLMMSCAKFETLYNKKLCGVYSSHLDKSVML